MSDDFEFEFKVPLSAVVCSRRNSGKTHMIKHIINHLFVSKLIDYVIIYSETAKISRDFSDLVDDNVLMDQFTEQSINKIINYQIKTKKKKQCLIVLDDTISCMGYKFMKEIDRLFSKARHWNISIVLISQYIKQVVSSIVRSNIDYLLYSVNTHTVLDFIYDIVVYEGTKKEFIKWSQDNTKDFQFIMFKNIHGGEWLFLKAPAQLELVKIKSSKIKSKV